MPPDAVVFDLDGTLIDSARDIQAALNTALANNGFAAIDLEAVQLMIGGGPELLVSRALESLGVPRDDYQIRRLTREFERQYRRLGNPQTTLMPGATPLLQRLEADGVPVGVCSNKPEQLCVAVLTDLGVRHYFGVVRGAGNGVPRKPRPDILLETIEALGASVSGTLYVGDSETDVATARSAGVEVVLVDCGYTGTPARELGADRVVDDLEQIAGLLHSA